jgi:hypothetical protein
MSRASFAVISMYSVHGKEALITIQLAVFFGVFFFIIFIHLLPSPYQLD